MPTLRRITSLVCVLLVVVYTTPGAGYSQNPPAAGGAATTPAATDQPAPKIPNDQLDSLVAPIALYPDPLLSQVLVASTYPLEIVQLQQYLEKNPTLKGKALTDAVSKQDWDPSIQAMAALPDAVKQLADNIQWTSDLGNAFLAQQADVMDAVQRMRQKAEGTGALKTTPQQTVQTQTVESKQVIVVQPASPDIVYVPSYNPVVVYGPPVYAYPPIYYPPYYPSTGAIVAASMISFGVGIAIGAAWGGGGWGWGCGWGSSNININVHNTFIHNSSFYNRPGGGGGGTQWQHDPAHRGGAPYPNRQVANRFGGTTANSSLASRQSNARQQIGQGGSRPGSGGGGTQRQFGQGASRPGGDGAGTSREGQGGFGRGDGGSANRVGDRSISPGSGTSRGSSALGRVGGGGGFNGASARMSSMRGAGSMSRAGGGGMRGGGGRRR